MIDVYDARGREKHHYWRTRENDVDLSTPEVSRLWGDANRLLRIENSFSIIDYTYDEAGQVETESTTVAGSGGTNVVRYCRYPNGEVSQVTYPNGSTAVNRNYTARGQLQSENWAGGNVTYSYHRDGKLDYEDYGNGVRSDLDYDGRGVISLSKTYRQSNGQTYAKRDYWRDDRDRILAWQKGSDAAANPRETGRGDRYEYDNEGQLTIASYEVNNPSGNATGAVRADWFHYDAMGNRAGWNDVASRGSMWFDRRENNLNQYQSWYNSYPSGPLHWGSAIYHDDDFPTVPLRWTPPGNGVTMADGWIVASYNALNQPVAIGCTGYGSTYMWLRHDPLGRCVTRWMGDANQQPLSSNAITYFYYDDWNLIQEGTTAGVADRVYVHGNRLDEIVASRATGGNWLYHHYDARGNCILQTNPSGGLQEQYEYDAFGWPYFYTATGEPARVNGKPGSPSGNRFLFTGREFLSGLRIYDYRNRIYQPELGRFLQPDPEEFKAGDYNLYRYCHNDPVNKSDPMGLQVTSDIWNDKIRWQSGSLLTSYQFSLWRKGRAYIATPTGNYKNNNVENHIPQKGEIGSKPGGTIYNIDNVVESAGYLFSNPTLNWYVQRDYIHTDVVIRELEHVSRYLYWQGEGGDGGAAIRAFNRNPSGIKNLKDKLSDAKDSEDQWQRDNIHARGRHILDVHPAKAMKSEVIKKAIDDVGPIEEPYLGGNPLLGY